MDNIIEQNELDKHTIQRYRFKVLGSTKIEDEIRDDDALEVDFDDSNKTIQNDNTGDNQNQFVEELLKKSDVLSTNIVKLQMQIEKQESDFAKRLKESVEREKEISFNEGYEKSKIELEQQYNEKVATYVEAVKRIDSKIEEFDEFFKKIESNLIETSLEIAKEVIKKEIETSSSDIAIALAKELVVDLKESSNITIKVNSENYEVLNDIFKDNNKVHIVSDDAITAGGVMLLSEKGNLDGNISARLEQIKCLLQNKSD